MYPLIRECFQFDFYAIYLALMSHQHHYSLRINELCKAFLTFSLTFQLETHPSLPPLYIIRNGKGTAPHLRDCSLEN